MEKCENRYAGSDTTIYRWDYVDGMRSLLKNEKKIISGLPKGGHTSRSIIIKKINRVLWLYVSIGSYGNIDKDDSRARILKFDISDPSSTYQMNEGIVFARGMRNQAAITMAVDGRIWGVENGIDDLIRDDLEVSLKENNPGEEINLFDGEKKFYGYPYCWSEYNITSKRSTGRNSQHVSPEFESIYDDDWCNNDNNVVKPIFQLFPHTAPLDLLWYRGYSFLPLRRKMNEKNRNFLFVTQHGSWNRKVPVGYRVSYVEFDENYNPIGSVETPFFYYESEKEQTSLNWPHRPVALALGYCPIYQECLYVTSDASNSIFIISYNISQTDHKHTFYNHQPDERTPFFLVLTPIILLAMLLFVAIIIIFYKIIFFPWIRSSLQNKI